jgi:hypothetical protein
VIEEMKKMHTELIKLPKRTEKVIVNGVEVEKNLEDIYSP